MNNQFQRLETLYIQHQAPFYPFFKVDTALSHIEIDPDPPAVIYKFKIKAYFSTDPKVSIIVPYEIASVANTPPYWNT